ncbi:hypothetical protein PRECH8_22310 [Insulibacter thermoxylanivorax]|uniref:Uncharacterized protein n=1 Tax=Insulibacter thermoxylanivorax TaxID=2749268 RepID=A0A916QDV4_9BACL|nr:hypothetical protein PRECH8_22310 [Insulibacter thermoxylanivorax]
MTQEHAFKAAELCLKAQETAVRIHQPDDLNGSRYEARMPGVRIGSQDRG